MAKEEINKDFDTFAWLIYKEVEKYINENEDEYNVWVQRQTKEKSGMDESDRETKERR